MNSSEKTILEAQLKRIVTHLFKDFLVLLQDLQQDNFRNVAVLQKNLPIEISKSLNFLDFVKYSKLRKKVLDNGNDSLREIQTILQDFEISFNKKN